MPRHPRPYLDHPGVLAFAHRGGALDAPENTMAAFAQAIAQGYRYLETDVHATADGVAVAFHDDTLDRVADRPGNISTLGWSDVRAARVGGEPIPGLDELLGAWPQARINLDPKTDAAAALLDDAIRRHDAWDRVCIGSFSGSRLAALRRRLGPRLTTSMGPLEVARLKLASLGVPTGGFAAACAQIPVREHGITLVTPALVAAAHARGLQVHVWTIDEEAEMERLIDLGVDGLMTDRPLVLKRVLERRGLWA
jgi:glycerophosphoryl diester phosphodiesterase